MSKARQAIKLVIHWTLPDNGWLKWPLLAKMANAFAQSCVTVNCDHSTMFTNMKMTKKSGSFEAAVGVLEAMKLN